MKNVKDNVVLVTGGASGIGRLMSLDFAQRGAKVVVWDINADTLKSFEDEGREKGFFIKGMVCDVTDREAVYRQAKVLEDEVGPLDILINNAGIVSGSKFLDTPDEKIEKTMAVNVLSLFWTGKAFLPSMIKRNSGHIVTISSAVAIVAIAGLADYSASKAAAFSYNEALRFELRRLKSKVRTTVICPSFIDTGMFAGVKIRFEFLVPIYKATFMAKQIVKAVLKNKKRLVLPAFMYMVYLCRIFPVGFFDAVTDFLGMNKAMDKFTGRKN
ncbi:MAG: SDR family NAD(P)-dependent oxidoreductase [Termitinemataceae bacterium]|nr:MAG: SDR family NAD(P)-dependent oxidoreductase [Termitinemataceae bacterium]